MAMNAPVFSLIFVPADVINRADVGMVEGGGGPRFAAETFQSLRIAGNVIGEELEGNETAELGVFGLVDHTHAAATQLFNNAIVRNCLADHRASILRR